MSAPPTRTPEQAPLFYGWRIVAAVFVMLAVSSGLGFYNLSVMLDALTAERGLSVATASAATALFFVVAGLAGLGIAVLLERYDPRMVIAGGAVLGAAALWLVGRVETAAELFWAYGLFGLGFSGFSLLPGTTLVARWFARRRSVALAVASTGLSVGGVLVTPLSARLIETRGLASATAILAVILLLGIVPITALVLRPRPETLGLFADGAASDPHKDGGSQNGIHYRAALRSRFFRFATAAYAFSMLAQVGGIAHQFKLVSGRVDAATAALSVSLLAGSSVVGRLSGGWLLAYVPMRGFTVLLMAAQAGALGVLARGDARGALLGGSIAFGLTVGNVLLLQPLLLAEAFGVRHYSRIYSLGSFLTTAGVAAGPALLGVIHDHGGGYGPAFATAAVASLLGAACLGLAGPLRQGAGELPAAAAPGGGLTNRVSS